VKKITVLIILLFLGVMISKAQPVPETDQYVLNPVIINPAYTGERGALSAAAFYRRQWVGVRGAPETITLSADSPFASGNMGLGFFLMNDRIGVTRETSVSASYSYKVKALGGGLSLGLRAGLLSTNTRWSDLVVLDPGDELYLADSRIFVLPDFGFGAYLSYEHFFAGFSIPRLLGYKFNYDRNHYSIRIDPGQYYYLFNSGYVFDIAQDVKFYPTTLLSLSPGEKAIIDINAHVGFHDRFWAGMSFRSTGSVSGLFQFAVNNQLKIAYSYYLDFSRIGRISNGTHEIMIRYDFLFKANVVNPLIF